MILGVGIDVVHIGELGRQLEDRASSFLQATFTADEIAYSDRAVSGQPVAHLAVRFAAKEAALKALDTACACAGVASPPVSLREIEVRRDSAGRPALKLHGAAAELGERLGGDRVWVSLSHEADYATAVVVVERLP